MIIGKDFVILNVPKTGTVFRHSIARYYSKGLLIPLWLIKPKVVRKGFYNILGWQRCRRTQFRKQPIKFLKYVAGISLYNVLYYLNDSPEPLHVIPDGKDRISYGANEIPVEDAHKEIVSVLRNPYRHLVSRYQCGIASKSDRSTFGIQGRHNFKFAEFVKQVSPQWARLRAKSYFAIDSINYPMGMLSFDFIRMCFKNPAKIFNMSAEEFDKYCVSDDYKKDMYPIKFFRLETHDKQFAEYLKGKPYLNNRVIDYVLTMPVGRNKPKKKADAVWDEETKAYFEKTEKFYIRMVKELAPLPEDDF